MSDGVRVYGHRCWHNFKLRCIAAKARSNLIFAAFVGGFRHDECLSLLAFTEADFGLCASTLIVQSAACGTMGPSDKRQCGIYPTHVTNLIVTNGPNPTFVDGAASGRREPKFLDAAHLTNVCPRVIHRAQVHSGCWRTTRSCFRVGREGNRHRSAVHTTP